VKNVSLNILTRGHKNISIYSQANQRAALAKTEREYKYIPTECMRIKMHSWALNAFTHVLVETWKYIYCNVFINVHCPLLNKPLKKKMLKKSETIFSRDRIPWKVNVQTRVAAIDAIFSRAARLGRRNVGDALSAVQFSPQVEIFKLWGGHNGLYGDEMRR